MKSHGPRAGTPYALLGLLTLKPMSGYDMRQVIAESVGHFWNESYGQIYPALHRMAKEGLVAKQTQVTAGRPDRHVYTLTEEGRVRLRQWLGRPVEREVPRNELLLKLFFGGQAEAGVSRRHVEEFLEGSERSLRVFQATAEFLKKERGGDEDLPFWLITLNRGRHDTEAEIRWARETVATLDALAADVRESGDLDAKEVEKGMEAGR